MKHAHKSRREFIQNVGGGMVIAGIGSALAAELGVTSRFAFADERSLEFGSLRSLADPCRPSVAQKLGSCTRFERNARKIGPPLKVNRS